VLTEPNARAEVDVTVSANASAPSAPLQPFAGWRDAQLVEHEWAAANGWIRATHRARQRGGQGRLSAEITSGSAHFTESFALTASVIFLAFLLVFRSPSARLMTMIPSLFAILSVFLVMRLAGIPLNIATILIGSTVLSATENDQIHFFYHFQEGRSAGTTAGALKHALLIAGRPILFATLINASGFLALVMSDLPPMREFGIVASSAFVLALLADFTALPGALWILDRYERQVVTPGTAARE
jgi:multidrug efflux pump subunit AcrB